jgi:hypothetical protein
MSDIAAETLYCANHPQVATALRCNRCGKPVCTRCIVRTPVGYRCRECVRGQQATFETANWYDYVLALLVAFPIGWISTALLSNLFFFMIILAPVAGGITAEIVRALVRRRRGRYLATAAAASFGLGCLATILLPLAMVLLAVIIGQGDGLQVGGFALLRWLWPLLYTAIATSTLFARLRGISIG